MLTNILPELVGEQCRILYLPENANQVILGVAGSGKSVEAAYRAIWISKRYPNEKILVLSVNRDVSDVLDRAIKSYTSTNNVEIDTIYNYFKKLVNLYLEPDPNLESLLKKYNKNPEQDDLVSIITNLASINSKDEQLLFKDILKKGKEKYPESTLWSKDNIVDFIKDEINWMQSNEIQSMEEYLDISRVGRGNQRISGQQRRVMFRLYALYYSIRMKKYHKFFSFKDVYSFAKKYCNVPQQERPRYIIIDEVQDISPAMFSALSSIIKKNGYWSVFGDISQNIFGQRISWTSLGLDKVKKQYRLKRNYRNTKQIGELAKAMLETDLFEKDSNFIEPSTSGLNGAKPVLYQINNNDFSILIEEIVNRKKSNPESSIAIILMNVGKENTLIYRLLKQNDIHYTNKVDEFNPKDNIFIDSINRIKGLEFNSVFVCCIDDIQPNMDLSREKYKNIYENPDNQKIIAKSVYVASTRARESLILFYRNDPLNFLLSTSTELLQKKEVN